MTWLDRNIDDMESYAKSVYRASLTDAQRERVRNIGVLLTESADTAPEVKR